MIGNLKLKDSGGRIEMLALAIGVGRTGHGMHNDYCKMVGVGKGASPFGAYTVQTVWPTADE